MARLAKDDALETRGNDRLPRLRHAAELYEAVATRYQRHFSCINAATLWLLAGEPRPARALALRARALATAAGDDSDRYWRAATEAEAALILGDVVVAREALERAARYSTNDFVARAVTRRQLRLVCEANRLDLATLEALAGPSIVHYCGHLIDPANGARFPEAEAGRVARLVREFLASRAFGFGYGSLASGADILVAEALLDAGAELHVVLPFGADEFEETSVAPAGPEWAAPLPRVSRASGVRSLRVRLDVSR